MHYDSIIHKSKLFLRKRKSEEALVLFSSALDVIAKYNVLYIITNVEYEGIYDMFGKLFQFHSEIEKLHSEKVQLLEEVDDLKIKLENTHVPTEQVKSLTYVIAIPQPLNTNFLPVFQYFCTVILYSIMVMHAILFQKPPILWFYVM